MSQGWVGQGSLLIWTLILTPQQRHHATLWLGCSEDPNKFYSLDMNPFLLFECLCTIWYDTHINIKSRKNNDACCCIHGIYCNYRNSFRDMLYSPAKTTSGYSAYVSVIVENALPLCNLRNYRAGISPSQWFCRHDLHTMLIFHCLLQPMTSCTL